MKKTLTICIIIFVKFICTGQELVINNLNVSDVKTAYDENIMKHDQDNGPYVIFNFKIKNNSDTCMKLDLKSSTIEVKFKFNNEIYSHEPIWNFLYEYGEIFIKSKSSKVFEVSTHLLLGTDFIKKGKTDYSIDLLMILPTLELIYSDDTGIKLIGKDVHNVDVN